MAGVQLVRHRGAIRMAHLAIGAIPYLRLEAAIGVGGHGGGVHLVSLAPPARAGVQQPGERAILAHGDHRAIEAVVFARVGIAAIGLHLVGGAGVVGGHIDLRGRSSGCRGSGGKRARAGGFGY